MARPLIRLKDNAASRIKKRPLLLLPGILYIPFALCGIYFYLPFAGLLSQFLLGPPIISGEDASLRDDKSGATFSSHHTSSIRSGATLDPLSLDQLTDGVASPLSCTGSFLLIENVIAKSRHLDNENNIVVKPSTGVSKLRKIPRIIHQTSKSRCVTRHVAAAVSKWQQFDPDDDWSYYFHDDEALMRLFRQEFVHFPLLEMALSNDCMKYGTLRADVWRYLILWVYGGVYADVDAVPNKFNATSILDEDDAYFVVEQSHVLSQYFIACSPRHPLMWYAIQHALLNLLRAPDTGSLAASMVTGPHALHNAYWSFRLDVGVHVDPAATGHKPVWAGQFDGTHNRSIRVVGVGEKQNEFIERDVLGKKKKLDYDKMGMRHFQDDKRLPTGRSCLFSVLESFSMLKSNG